MQCDQCGKEVGDDLKHCPYCGKSLLSVDTEIDTEEPGNRALESKKHNADELVFVGDEETALSDGDPVLKEGIPEKKKPSKRHFLIALAVVVLVALIGFGIWYAVDQHNRTVWEQEHQTYPIEISFIADGYEATNSSPIPLHVEGSDFEGNSVSADYLVGGKDNRSFSLMRGSYTVNVVSTPIAADGTIYDVANSSVQIEVADPNLDAGDAEEKTQNENSAGDGSDATENAEAGESGDAGTGDGQQGSGNYESTEAEQSIYEISLTPIDPLEVTEEQLQAAVDSLVAAGISAEEAQAYKDAAIAKAEQAKADQRAEKKDEFESRLYALRDAYRAAASTAGTQWDMNTTASDYYRKFDALLNEVYGYLSEVLSGTEMDALRTAQSEWVETRESKMWSAQSESFGGTMASLDYNTEGIDMTQVRITELINMIP